MSFNSSSRRPLNLGSNHESFLFAKIGGPASISDTKVYTEDSVNELKGLLYKET